MTNKMIDWQNIDGKLIEIRTGERLRVTRNKDEKAAYGKSNLLMIKSMCRYLIYYGNGRQDSQVDHDLDIIRVIDETKE